MSQFFLWVLELLRTKNYTWRLGIVQKILWPFPKLLGSKCADTLYATDTSKLKCFDFSGKQYIIWQYIIRISKYPDRKLCMKIWFSSKIFMNSVSFSFFWFFRTKWPNTPQFTYYLYNHLHKTHGCSNELVG